MVNIDSFTQDEVSQSYAKILLSTNDISEVDNSGDYNEVIEEETDLEYDSDVDEVVFTRELWHLETLHLHKNKLYYQYMNFLMARNYTMCLCHPTRHTWIYYRNTCSMEKRTED